MGGCHAGTRFFSARCTSPAELHEPQFNLPQGFLGEVRA
jgi:hypothetical protein